MPSAFRESEKVTLLGRTSVGGACIVQPVSSAWGTCFRISGPQRISYMKNGSYYDIDQGAEPDYTISSPVEETTVNQTEADALAETNAVAGAETASSSSGDDMSEEKRTFARIFFNYGSTLSLEPSSKYEFSDGAEMKKYEDEAKAIDFKLIPWGKQINSKSSEGRYFTIEPGLNLRLEPEKVNMTLAAYMENYESGKMYFTFDTTTMKRAGFIPANLFLA